MWRSILVALGAAACLLAFAALGEMPGGAVARAVAGVALGAGVTALVYGEATFASVALGAVSPLALAAMDRTSLGLAAAMMCLLWLAPRFVLADTPRKLAVLGAVSLVAAGVAGFIFAAYWEAPLAAHVASCVFAGSCLSLVGVVVPVATTTAHALRTSATAIEGPLHDLLLHAAQAHESSRWQARAPGARRQWRTLVRSSDQRAALQRASGADAEEQRRDLDQRIEVIALELAPRPAASGARVVDAGPTSPLDSAISAELAPDEVESSADLDIRIDEPSPVVSEAPTVPPSDV